MRAREPAKRFRREREAVRVWLSDRRFTHFVTLMLNCPYAGRDHVKHRLRDWDARMNREIVGPKWLRRSDRRMQWIAFPEKLEANPHWHLCLEVLPEQETKLGARGGLARLVDRVWLDLVPSGTTDTKAWRDDGALRYATKQLDDPRNYEMFVHVQEFIRVS